MMTDFGTGSSIPSAMKGRIFHIGAFRKDHLLLRVCDIAHNIPSKSLEAGAWSLKRTVTRFPPGSVHLAMVEAKAPSQPTTPQAPSRASNIIIRTHRFWMIGPDTGVLAPAAEETMIEKVYAIDSARFVSVEPDQPDLSPYANNALHVLAPVAALISCGEDPANFGTEITQWSAFPLSEKTMLKGNILDGEVVYFDRYGNAETNIMAEQIETKGRLRITMGNLRGVMHNTKYHNEAGVLGGWINSKGMLELFLTNLSLQREHYLKTGTKVRVHFQS